MSEVCCGCKKVVTDEQLHPYRNAPQYPICLECAAKEGYPLPESSLLNSV